MPNPGIPFDQAFVDAVPVWSVPAKLQTRDSDARIALRCLDLTTLDSTDTPESVRNLCRKGIDPMGAGRDEKVAAVCVYPQLVLAAKEALMGTGIRIATVAAAFPHGQALLESRVSEVGHVAAMGVDDIDVVIRRPLALAGDWRALYQEVRQFRQAAGGCHLKTILATGELKQPEIIAKAAIVCLMAGADFVKTSTGKEAVNATLEAGAAMAGAIHYYEKAGFKAGIKPAGGIKTTGQALDWCAMLRQLLGDDVLRPERFRIGASSLLGDLVDALGGND